MPTTSPWNKYIYVVRTKTVIYKFRVVALDGWDARAKLVDHLNKVKIQYLNVIRVRTESGVDAVLPRNSVICFSTEPVARNNEAATEPEEEAKSMKTAVTSQLVEVQIQGTPYKNYTFRCDIPGVTEGDLLVCDTVNGPVLATVISIPPKSNYNGPLKWVIAKVDLQGHEERKRKEREAAEIRRKLNEAKKAMEEKVMWEMLAEKSPEIAALLAQLNEIEN